MMEKNRKRNDTNQIKCWICGEIGNSGEHMIKASDLKLYFPDVSQKKPFYFHNAKQRNKLIGSIKSDHLKSNTLLCEKCNNQLTQPYDRAWEKLSKYLYKMISKKKSFSLRKVFPGCSTKAATRIQLYFMKLIGCLLIEVGYATLAQNLAISIRKGKPRKDVFLNFSLNDQDIFGISDLEVYESSEKEVLQLGWIYSLGRVVITILYFSDIKSKSKKSLGWSPIESSKKILLSDF